jgi:formylmethanofuran dehydrogenase subunit E
METMDSMKSEMESQGNSDWEQMKSFDEYLQMAGRDGHPRAGIILGIRMTLLGLSELGIDDPGKAHDDLVVVVETDRCLPDAVELVTGCRLGNRRLKLRDMGKMAATWADLKANRAVRVAAREDANRRATEMYPALDKQDALEKIYRQLPDDDLFTRKSVRLELAPEDFPGYQSQRVLCAECGEGIAFGRQILDGVRVLCRSCAGQGYLKA